VAGDHGKASFTTVGKRHFNLYSPRERHASLKFKEDPTRRISWTHNLPKHETYHSKHSPMNYTWIDGQVLNNDVDKSGVSPKWKEYYTKAYSGAAGCTAEELGAKISKCTVGRWEIDPEVTRGASDSVLLDNSL